MSLLCPVLSLALVAFAGNAGAQIAAYPGKPIRLVIGFAPGGAADSVARAMSDAFGKALGQPVIVDNKPGNGSSIAAELVAKSPADGYTLLIASPSILRRVPQCRIEREVFWVNLARSARVRVE
jgi:tripartite-type tricarboxylate transporter receptor subunit TctC